MKRRIKLKDSPICDELLLKIRTTVLHIGWSTSLTKVIDCDFFKEVYEELGDLKNYVDKFKKVFDGLQIKEIKIS